LGTFRGVLILKSRLAYTVLAIAFAAAVALTLGLLLQRSCAWADAGGAIDQPNVVLIVMDTARRDRLSCYGYDRETSPRLSELAESAATYTNAYSTSSWTAPGHASLFTGLFPAAHGATQEDWDLDEHLTTMAEALSARGYRTVGIVENPMLSSDLGYAQGFGVYHGVWLPRGRPGTGSAALGRFVEEVEATPPGHPLFVFVNLIEPHSPYNSSRQFYDRFVSDPGIRLEANQWRDYYVGRRSFSDAEITHLNELYDAELLYTDYIVGEMAAALRERDLLDGTVFVVTSDHGENIGDHGHMDHVFSLYETTTRIPLVIRYPTLFAPGSTVESPVQLTDLFPTILTLAGVDPDEYPSHGRSLLDDLTPDRAVLCEYYYPRQAIRGYRRLDDRKSPGLDPYRRRIRSLTAGGVKLIWGSDGRNELYDLGADPDERVDLIDSPAHSKVAAALQARLAELVDEHLSARRETLADPASRPETPDAGLDEATREALRSLGYLE
jgi:arylsulfatase A-like enzyme